jgi:hypothetical protein
MSPLAGLPNWRARHGLEPWGAAPTEANRVWIFKSRLCAQRYRYLCRLSGAAEIEAADLQTLNTFWAGFRQDNTHFVLDMVDPDHFHANDWDLFLFQGEARICSVDALSAGEQDLLSLAVPSIPTPFHGILLLDRPELHLHPEWQTRLLPALRRLVPNAQLIIATHSDLVDDGVMPHQRYPMVGAADTARGAQVIYPVGADAKDGQAPME